MAALDRDDTERPQHLGIDDIDDRRRVDPRECAFRCSAVELDAAGERVRQTAEQEVRVRHRRLRPAASVTGWSGIRAGALRPDSKRTACVTPDD